MLRRAACALARQASEAAVLASTSGSAATSSSSSSAAAWPTLHALRRAASSSSHPSPPRMPAEYERYYGNVTVPVARAVKAGNGSSPGATTGGAATTAASAAASTSTSAADARAGAAAASAWMFPWERRQLDGAPGGLRPWEKAYWGLFVGGLAFLLGSRLYRSQTQAGPTPETEAEVAAKAAAQAEAVRALLLGKSFIGDDDDDPLEGLSPEECQALAEKAFGKNFAEGDQFDGMSPEEINAWVEKHGEGAVPRW